MRSLYACQVSFLPNSQWRSSSAVVASGCMDPYDESFELIGSFHARFAIAPWTLLCVCVHGSLCGTSLTSPTGWAGSNRICRRLCRVRGHDIRRGAAADIFAERGVDAMLSHGNWRPLGGAAPYVPTDEVQAGLLAQGVIDESDPES